MELIIGQPLPEDLRGRIKRYLGIKDYRKISRATGYSYSSVNNLMNGLQNVTRLNSEVVKQLAKTALDRAREQNKHARQDIILFTQKIEAVKPVK